MRRLLTALLGAAVALCVLAAPAQAEFGVKEFSVSFLDSEGQPVSQAGSHPYEMQTHIHFNSFPTGEGGEGLDAAAKDILIAQPAGFIGNPTAVSRCSNADFLTSTQVAGEVVPNCPDAAAVGTVEVQLATPKASGALFAAVYNLVPPPGVAAKLGFWVKNFPITVELGVAETPPYNIVGGPKNITQTVEVVGSTFTLWGTPADHSHDATRGHCLNINTGGSLGQCEAKISPLPFLTMPRSCHGPLLTHYRADAWQSPGSFVEGLSESPGMAGCGKLAFGPQVNVQPSTEAAESSSGLDVEIGVADEGMQNPAGIAQADIEETEFRLPVGVTLNPSAAEGLGVCTLAQFQAASLADQGCPDASKLGSLEVQTPVLENHTLKGSFYLAEPENPSTPQAENPFGSLFAAYLTISDEELGVFVKLPAKITTDEKTGQIVTVVGEMPPFPLSLIKVHLRSGPRAPLITPPSCGAYGTEVNLLPSSGGAPLHTVSTMHIVSGPGGSPCPPAATPPFSPGFEAGSANSAASVYSPFSMRLTRADGQQDLTRFSATLPPGVTGKIAGVARCPDAAIAAAMAPQRTGREELAAPSCPAASRLGGVLAGAGVGTALTYVPGSLYLAGPYKGAPLSVVAIVPAVAGPFDVGVVVTRVGLKLNQSTAQVEVDGSASDPIPHILKGIPLKLRDLRVLTDRPNFTLNPTSCQPERTLAQIFGSGADVFNPADDVPLAANARYQAASCASLGFAPKLSLALKGGTRRAQHPALHSTVTYPYPSGPGYANIGKAVVTLPPSEFIDNAHINNPCTRVQFAEERCPPGSVLGHAKAITPLLESPLRGPVYFRSNGGERKLPDVVADLSGEGFQIVLVGKVDTATPKSDPRIRTTFDQVPDAPVSSFAIDLFGGKKGLLVNNRNLCAHKLHTTIELTGQNGKRHDTSPALATSCEHKKKHRHRHR